MSRKIFVCLLLCLIVVGQLWAKPFDRQKDSPYYKMVTVQQPDRLISPEDEIMAERNMNRPIRDDANDHVAIGEDQIVGYTWYDYQHNGSIGKMIARDSDGGTHFAWMCGYNAQQDPRHVLYNFIDEDGNMANDPEDHSVVDNGSRSGYCMISVVPEVNVAAVFYHVLGHVEDEAELGCAMSTDWLRGIGAFVPSYPPRMPNFSDLAWPHGDIDRRNFAHVTATENPEGVNWQRVVYWRGVPDEDFQEWDWGEQPAVLDTASVISAVVATSSQSDKVAMGWHHNRVGTDLGPWENALGGYQRNNDIVYVVSEDGEEWDFRDGIQSLTKIIPPDPDLVDISMEEAYGDTFRPYCDLDLQFDPWEDEDNLYAVFAASGFQEKPVPIDGDPVDAVYANHGHLWFWNSVEDTITMIADGWYDNIMINPEADGNFRPGAWRTNADRGSIAFNPDDPGTVYVVWTKFPHIADYVVEDDEARLEYIDGAEVQDTSRAGYLNAEIMVSISNDHGLSWRQPVNITQTIWEGDEAPEPGECQSENWPSVAKVADGALHITYVMDTDAGGIPQNEGTATESPVYYHRVDLDDLPENDLVEVPDGFMFHNYYDPAPAVRDIERDHATPVPDEEVSVSAEVTPPGNFDLQEVVLEYKVGGADGEMMSVEMSAQGDDIYAGSIPAMDDGDWVWYRVRAMDTEEGETIRPEGWWHSYVVRPEGELRVRDIQFRPAEWTVDYSPYMDYEVTFDGIITTNSDFATYYGGYGFQDAQEEWSGVILRGIEEDLNVGDEVVVTGTVREQDPDNISKWRYMTFIDVSSFEVVGNQEAWEPIQIEVDDMRFATRAENLEGCFVTLGSTEVSVRNGAPANYIPINNGDPDNLAEGWLTTYGLDEDDAEDMFGGAVQGTVIESLTGVFVENQRYAIAPREDGDVGAMAVKDDGAPTPTSFSLDPAFPNPFNSKTTIGFEIAKTSNVTVNIYDLEGRLVETLLSGSMQAGHYSYSVDAANYAAGMYLLRLEADDFTANQKLLLIK